MNRKQGEAYIVTGPTSGVGREAALDLAKHGTVVLVGRDRGRLGVVQRVFEGRGQKAVPVVCDLADPASVRRAAKEIASLSLPIVGLLNNAGIKQVQATKNALGWNMSFATNHLGPFALTEALAPHLPDGAKVLFVASAVEDPERKPAVAAGFRGARYLSAEASARGEWEPEGSTKPGFDAYATSKQAVLASALALARETPRLRVNAIEPGLMPTTGLRARRERLHPLPGGDHRPGAHVPAPAVREDPQHAEARRAGDRQDPPRTLGRDRRLLRRGRAADGGLRARARPEVPGPCCRRDARVALDGARLTLLGYDALAMSDAEHVPAPSRPSALRVEHGNRAGFLLAGAVAGAIATVVAGKGSPAPVHWLWLAGGAYLGDAIGTRRRRDHCSACQAVLRLQVFDEACPSCGACLTGALDNDGRRRDLPGAPPAPRVGERDAGPTPYRRSAAGERDAADAAERLARRSDVDARVIKLRAEPKIARALRDHDDEALHRILTARRRKATSIAEEMAIDRVRTDPRRALEPRRNRPWLGLADETGLVLYGARDEDPEDGTFVASQVLVIGSHAVAPLAAYVVRRRTGGGVDVIGRVPLSFSHRLWRAIVLVPAVLVAVLGVRAGILGMTSTVYLVNALDVPITVRAGREDVPVRAGSTETRTLLRGRQHLLARDGRGNPIEEQDVDVPGGDALVAYNVLGAAPIVAQEVYFSTGGTAPPDLGHKSLAGQRAVVLEGVGYPFVAAPREIRGRGTQRTWEVTQQLGGWRASVRLLREEGRRADAEALAAAVARLDGALSPSAAP